MYQSFIETGAHLTHPANSLQRPIAIGKHYRATIDYVCAGGIDAAREVAAKMGGVRKHHWSKFPQRLLAACQQAQAADMKPYTITHAKSWDGKPQRILRSLHVSWKFSGDTQVPVIEYW